MLIFQLNHLIFKLLLLFCSHCPHLINLFDHHLGNCLFNSLASVFHSLSHLESNKFGVSTTRGPIQLWHFLLELVSDKNDQSWIGDGKLKNSRILITTMMMIRLLMTIMLPNNLNEEHKVLSDDNNHDFKDEDETD